MKTLFTPRMILRGFRPGDAPDVYAYAQNPRVGPSAGWPPHGSLEESQKIVGMFIDEDNVWALELRQTGRVIGSIGLYQDAKRNYPGAHNIGYVLSEDCWGRGLMPEAVRAVLRHAFESLGSHILGADYYPFNTQSRRVMEKCGMVMEGRLRLASRIFTGEIYDKVCYTITREEYFALKPQWDELDGVTA